MTFPWHSLDKLYSKPSDISAIHYDIIKLSHQINKLLPVNKVCKQNIFVNDMKTLLNVVSNSI